MGPTALSWVLPRNKTIGFLIQHHIIQCLVPNIHPAGSPIAWQCVLETQEANIITKFLTFWRIMVPHLHSKAVPEVWLLDPKDVGTTLPLYISNYLSNDTASYPRITEYSATLLWQSCVSQHCCDNPESHILFTSTNFPANDITLHFRRRPTFGPLPLYLSAVDWIWWWTWQAFTKIILLHDTSAAVYNFCIRQTLEVNFW